MLDQDKHQIVDHVDDSLQLRGDEPVSELYIWGSKLLIFLILSLSVLGLQSLVFEFSQKLLK